MSARELHKKINIIKPQLEMKIKEKVRKPTYENCRTSKMTEH